MSNAEGLSPRWRNIIEDSKSGFAQPLSGRSDGTADRFELCQYIPGGNAEGGDDIDELDNIDPPLSGLILGDEGLRLAEHRREVGLRQVLLFADAHEQGLEALLSGRAQGFRHSEQGSLEGEEPFR